MKQFQFSLQPIRVLREQREREAQQRYAETLRRSEEAALLLQVASEELAAGWDSLCQDLSVGAAASKLHRTRAWCNVLEIRQKQRDAALKAARLAMNDAWREMILATREREALDRYHDKCRRAYDHEAQRHEQKRLDGLGLRFAIANGALRALPRPGVKAL
jgi:flagellar export protein FliJ